MAKLVLWDVDLTLVDYSGIGREWYAIAMTRALGVEMTHHPTFPGRTERGIVAEMLAAHGVDHREEHVQSLFTELVAISTEARDTLHERGRALPGAAAVLKTLAGRDDVVQSLVTGNLPELADHKLSALDLHHHVDFAIGGYGSLSEHRHDLVAHAMNLAEAKHGNAFAPADVVVIGDTPNDVACALHHGAVAIGVATGRHSAGLLAESGAHAVLTDLSDTPAVVTTLLG
ncbi:phosphoglycolate phosphatase-like HAD superfamily hydrolase [Herbihabitans rhizosphaerae]|uniref:Phosphoglycolate phosphatase-like HAD superfamily hydrolase n=1 Tax=Herbihabitans rhizosphaerae TaxID=1872711 RepID=A0A4Q7KF60_9PSEU|nr:haloacid dehalogenase-like hydrolase [Herbihabitans rhizosphaerae]RZS32533.1 phosphoglycolate phosphatase-like HAD superfamily hydrolase [Herbihabitans rhizosphaerae]